MCLCLSVCEDYYLFVNVCIHIGVFRPMEKIVDVRTFISEALIHQSHVFSLSALGKPVLDEEETLASTGLVNIMSVNLYTLLNLILYRMVRV